jgi:pyruvate/2-oxoglutarate/acetoin dehydrogenase E1 component
MQVVPQHLVGVRAWSGERFSYAGRFHSVQDVQLQVLPVQRVAARDGIIPSARPLEDDMLPSVEDVVAAVMALEGTR